MATCPSPGDDMIVGWLDDPDHQPTTSPADASPYTPAAITCRCGWTGQAATRIQARADWASHVIATRAAAVTPDSETADQRPDRPRLTDAAERRLRTWAGDVAHTTAGTFARQVLDALDELAWRREADRTTDT